MSNACEIPLPDQAPHVERVGATAGLSSSAAVWRRKPFLSRVKQALLDLLGAENTRLRRELAALKAVIPRQRELTAELQRQRTELEAELAAQRAEVLACRQMFWQQRKLLAARLPAADPREGVALRPRAGHPPLEACFGQLQRLAPGAFPVWRELLDAARGPSRAIPWTVAAWRGIAWPRNFAPL